MSRYVKIKKSKNLRFKLISLLYLLFISLTMIQIPIEWLRINEPMAKFLMKPKTEKIKNNALQNLNNLLLKINTEFDELITNKKTGKIGDESEYSSTDQYFIGKSNGIFLHEKLKKLAEYYDLNPLNKPLFDKLFNDDLKNGLKNSDGIQWIDWKFKHTPASVVKTMIADLFLKVNLLNGSIEVTSKQEKIEPIIKMAFNTENARVGDSIKLVITGKNDVKVTVNEGGSSFELNNWMDDTLFFIPKHAGEYQIVLDKNGNTEQFTIKVKPEAFNMDKNNRFQTFYQGKANKISFANIEDPGSASCDCDRKLRFNKEDKYLIFNPNKNEWCRFYINSSTNKLVLYDSIYVQSVPEPFILAEGAYGNKISLNRLLQTRKLTFEAKHPELPYFDYKVASFNIRYIGLENKSTEIFGNDVNFSIEQIRKIKYIILENILVQSPINKIKLNRQFVYQIIN